MRRSKAVLALACMLVCTLTAAAQNRQISGTVVDEKGEGLPGATVVVKGTTLGISTNTDGKFVLSVPSGAVLVISSVGYESQEKTVGDAADISVRLTASVSSLSEVVVVGYGESQRRDITGAISSVTPRQQDAVQFNSPDALLRGRAPGVSVQQQSSQPGAAVSVKIRGTNSLRSDNEPLYVVDGIIINSATEDVRNPTSGAIAGGDAVTQQNGLTAINSLDIASIEVLKDASATAIYGSRGANGVVIITTKRGKAGAPTITFTANTQLSRTSKYLNVLDGASYARYRNQLSTLAGGPVLFNADTIQSINWQRDVQGTGVAQTYRLSASGGSKEGNTKYYVAGGYLDTKGIIDRTGSTRGDIKINLTQRLSDKLSIDFGTAGSLVTLNSTSSTEPQAVANTSLIAQMLQAQPLLSAAQNFDDPNQELTGPRSFIQDYDDISQEQRIIGNLSLNYRISDIFTYRLNLAGDYRDKVRSRYFGLSTFAGLNNNGIVGKADLDRKYYLIENLLLFNKAFNPTNRINGTFGVTYDNTLLADGTVSNANFFDQSLRTDGLGTGSVLFPSTFNKSKTELFSVLARVNYSLRDRYVLTLSGRLDGSSKFADGNKYSLFPAVSAAWLLNEEDFLKGSSYVSTLKLRGGYGETGNQSINAYNTFTRYSTGPNNTYVSGNTPVVGAGPANIGNDRLIWETTRQGNIGVDFGFFTDRVTGSVDAYYKQTTDLLQNFPLALSSGFGTITSNRGSLENKGIEFAVNGLVVETPDLNFNVGANMSFNRNKILDLALPPSTLFGVPGEFYVGPGLNVSGQFVNTPINLFAVGQPIGVFYGYKTNGIYQSADETVGVLINGTRPQPGDYRIVDTNGDGNVTATDRVIIGDPNPDFTFGFTSNFTYKAFSVGVFLDGTYGNQLVNATEARLANLSNTNNVLTEYYENAWSLDNPSNVYPRVGYNLSNFVDVFVQDASFLRFSTATIGYKLALKKPGGLKAIDFNVTGRNLALLTKYKGFDPEVNSFGFDSGRIGVDQNSYPNSRGLTFGVTATF
ncbi:TonB-dependent receptor [Hymenobacter sp.]|uniref:SusC/RagA family TonB-linked outer membrane protein n=1 Tax=Hymenobacter sp. TaxID=1898978 RepID=UPI00286B1E30|nr:TonB-dependent receptor [Hymenobacter sp.]